MALASLVIVGAALGAEESTERVTILGDPGARTVQLKSTRTGEVAEVRLLVRNDTAEAATPTVRLLTAEGALVAAGKPDPASDLALDATAEAIEPGAISPVIVSIKPASETLTGELVVGFAGTAASEALVPITTPDQELAQPTVQPDAVTLHITRVCPDGVPVIELLCGGNEEAGLWLKNVAPVAERPLFEQLAASDQGHETVVSISSVGPGTGPGPTAPDGFTEAIVESDPAGHGSYETTFVLDPEAKSQGQVKVSLKVQDWWLWPLLALLAGALIGYRLRVFYGPYRQRLLLQARLQRALQRYSDTSAVHAPGLYPLTDWFGSLAEPAPTPTEIRCRDEQLLGWAKLWCQVRSSANQEELDSFRARVDRLDAEIAWWRAINEALGDLKRSVDRVFDTGAARGGPVYEADSSLLADGGLAAPGGEAGAKGLVAALRSEAALLPIYQRGRRLWATLSPDEQKAHPELDPDQIYTKHKRLIERSEQDSIDLRNALTRAVREIPKLKPAAEAEVLAKGERVGAIEEEAELPQPRIEAPTTDQLEQWVKISDKVVFWATLLISAAAYMLTLYVGKNFGSASQYLEAFTAGFLGQVLVGVAVLPAMQTFLRVPGKPLA